MAKDRKHHFHEGAGNPIVGYSHDETGAICRDCGKNEPEFASINPRTVTPIHFDDVGEGSGNPDGFTCASCGDVIGAWDYKGGE